MKDWDVIFKMRRGELKIAQNGKMGLKNLTASYSLGSYRRGRVLFRVKNELRVMTNTHPPFFCCGCWNILIFDDDNRMVEVILFVRNWPMIFREAYIRVDSSGHSIQRLKQLCLVQRPQTANKIILA
jgi:hypothetical protein